MNDLINLDYQSRTPIYEQIVKQIEKYIALGVLKPGEQISSIRDLAMALGVNPNTVKKAYDILENKRIIKTLSTKGTFVASDSQKAIKSQVDAKVQEIKKMLADIEKLGVSKDDILKKI